MTYSREGFWREAAGTVAQDCRELCRALAQKALEGRELAAPN